MTLRDVISEKRKEYWKEVDIAQMGEELELIIDRIDKIETRISKIERPDFVEREGNRVGDWDISKAKIPPELAGIGPYDLSAAHDFTGPGDDPEE